MTELQEPQPELVCGFFVALLGGVRHALRYLKHRRSKRGLCNV
jgi:hypothetical protein